MKNLEQFLKDLNKDYKTLIDKYSIELGKIKGGLVKCELQDLTNYTEHDSILDAADTDYHLADKIIMSIYDGEKYVKHGDYFYSFNDDFYDLPGMYVILRYKRNISESDRLDLIKLLGPNCGEC